MLLGVLSVCSPEELEDSTSSEEEAERALIDGATTPAERAARRQQIKNKIRAVGRLQVMFQNLRYDAAPASVNFYSRGTYIVKDQRMFRSSTWLALEWMVHTTTVHATE
jgi:hypothetical protein